MDYICYFDGSCGPINPGGVIGIGTVIYKVYGHYKEIIREKSGYIEADIFNSNNMAEYMALIDILEWFDYKEIKDKNIKIYGDSKMVINQMKGRWRIGEGMYNQVAQEAQDLLLITDNKLHFKWVPREQNTEADKLSKHKLNKELCQV